MGFHGNKILYADLPQTTNEYVNVFYLFAYVLEFSEFQNEYVFVLWFVIVFSFLRADSGVYVMKFLELCDPLVNVKDKFTNADVKNIIIKYVNDMIFQPFNDAQDGIQLLKTYDKEVMNCSCQ